MLGFGQSMIDIGAGAGEFESMCAKPLALGEHSFDFYWGPGVTSPIGEMNSVVGEHRVDFVGNGLDQSEQKVGGDLRRGPCSSTRANFEVRSIATNM